MDTSGCRARKDPVGVHAHDVVGLRDHLAPGSGSLSFESLLARLPHTAVVTLEVDWYLTEPEVVAGRRRLQEAMEAAWRPS